MIQIMLDNSKKVYFASDFHLGYPDENEKKHQHERLICSWLEHIQRDVGHLFLVGDIFDLWFEYRHVVPKGFIRFLGKLAEMRDKNISITIFTGNHDCWMYDYFTTELGVEIYHQPKSFVINQKKFYIAHGDALGPGDYFYKFIRTVLFRNPLAQYLFRTVLPADIGMGLAKAWVRHSYRTKQREPIQFFGEKEWLQLHSKQIHQTMPHEFYIYGHRHLPMRLKVDFNAWNVNLGDWLNYRTFAVFDGQELQLQQWNGTFAIAFEKNFHEFNYFSE
ncbi:MAG: UDP-2,3-diacylglucosamine diphosphatase [Cytophagales bacterium]|nr:UDP-2,3-diacylglucosamine diphosphatase [Cytophagales bacterium]MDW8383360.1 UDP-2,3-diacylglucosamine diphosphatase [Flammeovirgaceae bacterium]